MLTGVARKIGVALTGVTGLWWLVFVIGFGLLTAANTEFYFSNPISGSIYFPQWIISLGGIPLIALAVARAVVSRAPLTKILGTITTFFSILFLVSLGMILYNYGAAINFTNANPFRAGTLNHPVNIMFAGSLLASLCWTVQMMLWPFYEMDQASN